MPLFSIKEDDIFTLPIMIIDDGESDRTILKIMLEKRGFNNIIVLEDATNVIEHIKDTQPELIILDIAMPGVTGYECTRLIRDHPDFFDLPILIQTGMHEPNACVKAFKAGATDFINKPVNEEELFARVKVHIENRNYIKNLELYKIRVSEELENARKIQTAALPAEHHITKFQAQYDCDIAAHFEPCSELGGDLWGIKALLPQQGTIWISDMSGHGAEAALNAFHLQVQLNEHTEKALYPGEYMTYLNEKLLQVIPRGRFATMFYGVINYTAHQLQFSCAGCTHPVLFDADTQTARTLDGSGIPLGISLQQYDTYTTDFKPNDILFLYSDALIENHHSNTLPFITEEELASIIEEYGEHDAKTIKNALLTFFKEKTTDNITDDLTLLVCKRHKTA